MIFAPGIDSGVLLETGLDNLQCFGHSRDVSSCQPAATAIEEPINQSLVPNVGTSGRNMNKTYERLANRRVPLIMTAVSKQDLVVLLRCYNRVASDLKPELQNVS